MVTVDYDVIRGRRVGDVNLAAVRLFSHINDLWKPELFVPTIYIYL